MLTLLFPRTADAAAVALAWQAARREHDRRIGNVGAFHLFRLPSATEEQLQRLLRQHDPGQVWIESATSFDVALQALRVTADGNPTPDIAAGPRRFGPVALVERSEASLREIASIYLAGVEQRIQVLPYFPEPVV